MPYMGQGESPLETTATLLSLIRGGDVAAKERLLSRIYRPLIRFAHGRLPARARDLTDTEDLVQVAMLRALDHIDGFDPRHEGAFLAYLRNILMNLVRDEARRVGRRPEQEELGENHAAAGPSPLDEAVGHEALERYDECLAKLAEEQREAVILRVEMGYTYEQIADAMSQVSVDAARMMTTRAIARLGKLMRPEKPQGA